MPGFSPTEACDDPQIAGFFSKAWLPCSYTTREPKSAEIRRHHGRRRPAHMYVYVRSGDPLSSGAPLQSLDCVFPGFNVSPSQHPYSYTISLDTAVMLEPPAHRSAGMNLKSDHFRQERSDRMSSSFPKCIQGRRSKNLFVVERGNESIPSAITGDPLASVHYHQARLVVSPSLTFNTRRIEPCVSWNSLTHGQAYQPARRSRQPSVYNHHSRTGNEDEASNTNASTRGGFRCRCRRRRRFR